MAISQHRSKRKVSGGRYKKTRKKCAHKGNLPTLTKIGERKTSKIRARGNNTKIKLLNSNIANVFDPKEKKYHKLKIETIVDSPADRHFIRRNVITKGAIIKTARGNARVLNRPGQEGTINAILVHS